MENKPFILDLIQGYHIARGKEDALLVNQKIQEILQKVAIKTIHPRHNLVMPIFLSPILIVPKKDITHKSIPYKHFKMKGLFLLKKII